MKDSILKGTGNSRFLKSAVPAGTSWADALAMLQAGTFPVDFNGINTEGFQQVGTPLNKANLLKDATAAQIGLPPSTTPDGMFQALAKTGDLHVWRKTTVTPAGTTTTYPVSTNPNAYQEGSDAKPAGYVLGSKTKTWAISSSSSTATARATLASSVSVGNDGTVSLVSPNTNTPVANETNSQYVSVARDYLRGSFLQRSDGTIWYIPSDANVTSTDSGVSEYGAPYNYCFVAEMQPVTGYAAIPAGTTIKYLGKLGNKLNAVTGSYVGSGVYGSSYPNKIITGFPPKLVIVDGPGIRDNKATLVMIRDMNTAVAYKGSSSALLFNTIDWLPDGVQWWSDSMGQGSTSGETYRYLVIG